MPKLYPTLNQKGLLLYDYNQQIILRHKSEHNFGQPIILCEDYDYGLHETVFNSTLYFTYINVNGDLITRSLLEHTFPSVLSKVSTKNYYAPNLVAFSGKLLLFYVCESRGNQELCCQIPYENQMIISIPIEPIRGSISYRINSFESAIFIGVESSDNTIFLVIDKHLSCHILTESEKNQHTEIEQKEKEISHLQAQIESAKSQYNELMNVAEEYRKEAIKWNKKYLEKRSR